jgi:hypothetical protein
MSKEPPEIIIIPVRVLDAVLSWNGNPQTEQCVSYRRETLREALGMDETYSAVSCLLKLCEAASHLLCDHNCDCHGYEEINHALRKGRQRAKAIEQALKESK